MKILSFIKYLFSIIIIFILFILYKEYVVFFASLFELIIIYILSNKLIKNHYLLGNIINSILLILFNTNIMFRIFSVTYLSYIMITNTDSISALSTKLFVYVPCFILVIVISILPVTFNNKNIKSYFVIPILIIYAIFFICDKVNSSPIIGYKFLIKEIYDDYVVRRRIKLITNVDDNEFYRNEISDNISYDNSLGDNPNIILIFTEGLSSNIIYDDRNIMPNVKNFLSNSISFSNYYNHSSATYRGLIGQLYSGFQYDHYDENRFISIQKILKDNGYYTEFINPEPNNDPFVKYLKSFNYDSLVSPCCGDIITDKDSYNFLYDEAMRLNNNSKPFFLTIYTYQTHVGCDSDDYRFGNGKNNVLNRFANNDYQFSEFLKKFDNSELFNDTILIYTTDHASYVDNDYYCTFKKYKRDFNFLDKIPFAIYHKGVEPRIIDVNGRNTLDLAPTLLDYIDVSAPNYFLGSSLFGKDDSKYNFDYYYTYPGAYYSTYNSKITKIDDANELINNLSKYYAVSKK